MTTRQGGFLDIRHLSIGFIVNCAAGTCVTINLKIVSGVGHKVCKPCFLNSGRYVFISLAFRNRRSVNRCHDAAEPGAAHPDEIICRQNPAGCIRPLNKNIAS